MPWKEVGVVDLRKEFVFLVKNGEKVTRLCENFGISRKTGYKWLERFERFGEAGLENFSRRPANSPERTGSAMEESILKVRQKHPAWGGRKIRRFLHNRGLNDVPAASTISKFSNEME